MEMAFLVPRFISHSLGYSMGQTSLHSPQPVQFLAITYFGFLRTFTLKLPTYPSTLRMSALVITWTLGWRITSTILGPSIHMLQSKVGKVLSSCAMCPPMLMFFSTRYTWNPIFAKSKAELMPAMPPPITKAFLVTGTSMVLRGLSNLALATAILIVSFAFSVASFGLLGCTRKRTRVCSP